MPHSRPQERIAELCSKVIQTNDLHEFQQLASELRIALKEHMANLQTMVDQAKSTISQLPAESLTERRKTRRKTS